MGGVSPAVWLVVSIVLVVGMLFGFFSARGRQRRARSNEADLRGWVYKGTQISLARRWPGEPFVPGARQEVHDIVTGNALGTPFTSMTYLVASSGEGPMASYQVVVFPVPDAVPQLALDASPQQVATPAPEVTGPQWARLAGGEVVTWRAGEARIDLIEPMIAAVLAPAQ